MWLCTKQKKGARGFGKMVNTLFIGQGNEQSYSSQFKGMPLKKIETELTNTTQATMPEKKLMGLRQRTVVE